MPSSIENYKISGANDTNKMFYKSINYNPSVHAGVEKQSDWI